MSDLPQGWRSKDPVVICLGMSALDHIWTLPELPHEPGKHRAGGFHSAGGGIAATASVAVARLGGRSRFWGRAGADAAGDVMRADLAREGVDVSNFRLFDGARSSVSGVMVDADGERLIVNFRGADLPDDPSWLPLDDIAGAGAVLADPRWPDGIVAAFTAARAAGVPTILDGDVAEREVFERILPLTDHAIFSEQSLAAFAGADTPLEAVAAYGCRVAAVTRGPLGVDWFAAGQHHHHPACKVAVVDTTGAGDVFHGAWAMAVAAGADTASAAGFAAAAAALKCTRPGGRSGIPGFHETLTLWRPKT